MIASWRESGQKAYLLKASYLMIHMMRQESLATEIRAGNQ
jgi:hypothetical protein